MPIDGQVMPLDPALEHHRAHPLEWNGNMNVEPLHRGRARQPKARGSERIEEILYV
jgi:hypothetical protein